MCPLKTPAVKKMASETDMAGNSAADQNDKEDTQNWVGVVSQISESQRWFSSGQGMTGRQVSLVVKHD